MFTWVSLGQLLRPSGVKSKGGTESRHSEQDSASRETEHEEAAEVIHWAYQLLQEVHSKFRRHCSSVNRLDKEGITERSAVGRHTPEGI